MQKNEQTQEKQNFKSAFFTIVQKWKVFLQQNYIAFELVLFGLSLALLALMPGVHLICDRFLEVVDQKYSFYQVAFWLFGKAPTATSVFLSLFAWLFLLCALGAIVVGVIGCIKKSKKEFLINQIFHVASFVVSLVFMILFFVWRQKQNVVHLQVLGFDTIFFNFHTMKSNTYAMFITSFVVLAFNAVYLYHYRNQIFVKSKDKQTQEIDKQNGQEKESETQNQQDETAQPKAIEQDEQQTESSESARPQAENQPIEK